MTRMLIIMRGLPGSGKSTFCETILEGFPMTLAQTFTTDDFFVRDGEYCFDPKKLTDAHHWNCGRVYFAMNQGVEVIIVDNTNTQAWEVTQYIRAAQRYEYEVDFAEPNTSWARDPVVCAQKNRHGVPEGTIRRMLERWEEDLTIEKCLDAKPPWFKDRKQSN